MADKDEEPNGIEEGEGWENIGSQRQAKFDLIHKLRGDEDHLLTHLSHFIASKREDPKHQMVQAESENPLNEQADDFSWLGMNDDPKKENLFDGPLESLDDLMTQQEAHQEVLTVTRESVQTKGLSA